MKRYFALLGRKVVVREDELGTASRLARIVVSSTVHNPFQGGHNLPVVVWDNLNSVYVAILTDDGNGIRMLRF